MKIMIATPAMSGQVDIRYAMSLSHTLHDLHTANILWQVHLRRSGSLLIAERNTILEEFRNSDATHLLCIDADIGWKSQDIFRLIRAEKPLIGACYPSRNKGSFIFRPLYKTHLEQKGDHIPMLAIPAGFFLLSKEGLQKMIAHFPELHYQSLHDNKQGYGFFNTMVKDGEYWGEDFSFFVRANQAGIEVLVDPSIELEHGEYKSSLNQALAYLPENENG